MADSDFKTQNFFSQRIYEPANSGQVRVETVVMFRSDFDKEAVAERHYYSSLFFAVRNTKIKIPDEIAKVVQPNSFILVTTPP